MQIEIGGARDRCHLRPHIDFPRGGEVFRNLFLSGSIRAFRYVLFVFGSVATAGSFPHIASRDPFLRLARTACVS